MSEITEDRLAELERLASEATAGPWEAIEGEWVKEHFQVIDVPTGCDIIDTHNSGCASDPRPDDVFFSPENSRFIAASRTAVPDLVAEVRRLQADNAALRRQLTAACERIHGQSELLTRRAQTSSDTTPEEKSKLDALRAQNEAEMAWLRGH